MNLEAYLRRIGLSGTPPPTLEGLRTLQLAHATHIPFENLDVQLGRPIRLDLDVLEAKLVGARRGGYCFEQNTLFAAVLEELGFRVATLEARVRFGTDRLLGRTHMALRVALPEGPWITDVGFGADGLLGPVPWGGDPVEILDGTYRLRPEGSRQVLERGGPEAWEPLYALEPEPVHPIDFEVANHYTSTHPASRFTQTLTAQLPAPPLRHTLRDRTYEVREGDRVRRREVRDSEELRLLLRDVFGLDFPADTRFRNPVFAEGTSR
jgi:N-hydroxyarylamine O-acetyltransferase